MVSRVGRLALSTALACVAALALRDAPAARADGASMSLRATGNVTCAAPQPCLAHFYPDAPARGSFNLEVVADAIPPAGYVGIDLDVSLAALSYLPPSTCLEDLVWPSIPPFLSFLCTLQVSAGPRVTLHGQSDDVIPPMNISHFTGTLASLDAYCPRPGMYMVQLAAGTHYTSADLSAVSIKDQDPVRIESAYTLPVRCAGVVPGDASADGSTNAIDALFILQYTARFLLALPDPYVSDVNDDATIDSVDAALILQYDAGLIHL